MAIYADLIHRYGKKDSGWAGPVFFLRYGRKDPPTTVLEQVKKLWPDIRPASEAAPIDMQKRGTRIETKRGTPGVILWISAIELHSPKSASACAGIYLGPLAAQGNAIELSRSGMDWRVIKMWLVWQS